MNRATAGPPERSSIEDAASLPTSDWAAAADLRATVRGVEILVFRDLAAAAAAWGGFVRTADCTVFQTFGYLSAWQRDIGAREGSEPLVVFGRRPDGTTSFLLPFARDRWHGLRRLRWLGQDLCDYTGPILATDFSDRGDLGSFVEVWKGVLRLLASAPETRVEIIDLRKMPDHVGRQFNPFCYLEVDVHPAGAHYAEVGRDWDAYYKARRSSSTRSRDRSLLLAPGANPLYGLNTLGGALAFQTKSGKTHPGTDAELTVTDHGRRRADLAHGAQGEGGWHSFIGATLFDDEGWRQHSAGRLGNVLLKLGQTGRDTDWSATLLAGRSRLLGNGLLPDLLYGDDRRAVYTYPDTTRNRLAQGTLNLTHRLNQWDPLESTCRHASLSIL